MRESVPHLLTERRHTILRTASAALQGRPVTMWRVVRAGQVEVEVASDPIPSPDLIAGEVADALSGWGVALDDGSLWIVCKGDAQRWHVAQVRADVPAPPPPGARRRSPERLTLDLTGLLLGVVERVWLVADQATVYLCAALAVIETCLGRVREADGLTTAARARLLADLADVASSIDGALGTA